MSRGPAKFRQADLTRAVKGMVNAGIDEARIKVRIDEAGINITLRSEGEAAGTDDGAEANEWDEVLSNDGKTNAKIR